VIDENCRKHLKHESNVGAKEMKLQNLIFKKCFWPILTACNGRTLTLNLGMVRQVFYYCATTTGHWQLKLFQLTTIRHFNKKPSKFAIGK
jgi:hypothetical protein